MKHLAAILSYVEQELPSQHLKAYSQMKVGLSKLFYDDSLFITPVSLLETMKQRALGENNSEVLAILDQRLYELMYKPSILLETVLYQLPRSS